MKNFEATTYLDIQHFKILDQHKFLSKEITPHRNNSKSSLFPTRNKVDASLRGKSILNQNRSLTSFLLRLRTLESKTRFIAFSRPRLETNVLRESTKSLSRHLVGRKQFSNLSSDENHSCGCHAKNYFILFLPLRFALKYYFK